MPQQNPIVVEVVKQPDATPEISYGSVLLSAVNLVGVILGAALLVGAIVGGVIILRKRRDAAKNNGVTEPSHVRLHIQ
ncbi:MAG: hypothetical protein ABL986_10140 [Vicinamibacterales bacterium]